MEQGKCCLVKAATKLPTFEMRHFAGEEAKRRLSMRQRKRVRVFSPSAFHSVVNDVALYRVIDGTLNVIRQAERAGVKKIIVTSSIVTVVNPKGTHKNDGISFSS